jgi:hypothetical protein
VATGANKKVVIERFDRPTMVGYANRNSYWTAEGLEILDIHGQIAKVPANQVKTVLFVRDFPDDPTEAQPNWVFQARPKMNGLWVRLKFQDGDVREALMSNNLLELGADGVTVTPPNLAGNTMQAFIPRVAMSELAVLGVVGSPLRRTATAPAKKKGEEQIGLFSD